MTATVLSAATPIEVSKEAELIKFFAQQYPGVPRTRLAKLVYMADLLSRQYLGHPITSFIYRKDNYGPYDRRLPDVIKELEAAGLAEERPVRDDRYRIYRLYDSGKAIRFHFSPGEHEVLRYVSKNYIEMEWREFLEEVVYETPPMKPAPPEGELLDMESQNDLGTKEVGFRLEDVLHAERELDAGEYVTWTDFLNELRAERTERR